MPKRSSSQRADDPNQSAFEAVAKITGPKNPAAVELGRLGGLKGGDARAKKLSAKERSEIAKKAAMAMWAKRRKSEGE